MPKFRSEEHRKNWLAAMAKTKGRKKKSAAAEEAAGAEERADTPRRRRSASGGGIATDHALLEQLDGKILALEQQIEKLREARAILAA